MVNPRARNFPGIEIQKAIVDVIRYFLSLREGHYVTFEVFVALWVLFMGQTVEAE
jgi:hypothetical protein